MGNEECKAFLVWVKFYFLGPIFAYWLIAHGATILQTDRPKLFLAYLIKRKPPLKPLIIQTIDFG